MFDRFITPVNVSRVNYIRSQRLQVGLRGSCGRESFEVGLFELLGLSLGLITTLMIIKLVNLLRLLPPAFTCSGRDEGVIMGGIVTLR